MLSVAFEFARPLTFLTHRYIMAPSTRSRSTIAIFAKEEASTSDPFDVVTAVSSTPSGCSESPLSKMKVSELKMQLRALNLPVSGVKLELIERLEEYISPVGVVGDQSSRPVKSKYFESPMKASTSPSERGAIADADVKTPAKAEKVLASTPMTDPRTPTRTSKKSPSRSASKSPRKRPKIEPGSLQPPPNWERIYSLVTELRADRTAPVDSDGASALPETHLGEVVYRFQVLIALMLSSQTKDALVGETMRALQQHGLTVQNIHQTDAETLNSLISKVGFHNNKTKYIKQSAEIILEQYDGDIPPTAEEMMNLPGVGPKMAFIVEHIAFDTSTGIGVDTHMHRMFNDLKWVKSTSPEGTREELEGWLPREKWGEINALWVGFGQEVQQQKEKSLRKALACSAPGEALRLMKKLRLDVVKEGKRFGLEAEIKSALNAK